MDIEQLIFDVSRRTGLSTGQAILSHNSPDLSLGIFNSIEHFGLKIDRAAFSSGAPYTLTSSHLTDTFERIADHKINRIDELLPWNWRTAVIEGAA